MVLVLLCACATVTYLRDFRGIGIHVAASLGHSDLGIPRQARNDEIEQYIAQPSPFAAYSFFIPSNAKYYEYFYSNRPYLAAETIVWKVNAHLHRAFYTNIQVNTDTNPLLVNPFYRLPPGFTPYPLVPVNSDTCNLLATPATVAAFYALRESARENGMYLYVVSAFRTAEHQARLFAAHTSPDGVVARPYHSEHQTGRALDLGGAGGLLDRFSPSATGIWVGQNAHLYGFIVRYGADITHITGFIHEPWHITYVGVPIATYMYENGIVSLEEFVGRYPNL